MVSPSFWQGKRVLVTGGAGFIGSEIVRMLSAQKKVQISVLDKMTYAADLKRLQADEDSYELERVALENLDDVQNAVQKINPDIIIHCAAESHVDRSIDGPANFIESNIVGTFNLLQAAFNHWSKRGRDDDFRFLHISTDEVYGSLGSEGLFSEESRYDPKSPYSATKAASDHLVRAWGHTYGLPIVLTNCGNNYGPWQFPEKLIPLMILLAKEGKALPLYGDGAQIREWIHVSDHVSALLLAIEKGGVGETYLIGSGEEKTNRDVVGMICHLMDQRFENCSPHAGLIKRVEDRPGHDQRYALDSSKFMKRTGWKPLVSFESGLEQTLDWYLEHENWWRPLLTKKYNGSRLGILQS